MLHYFRHNRHGAFVRVLMLLVVIAWLPPAALGCGKVHSGEGGEGGMSHCGFCPPHSQTHHHEGQVPPGSGCDVQPCPAMQAADNSQLLDEGVGLQSLLAVVPVRISIADRLATGVSSAPSPDACGRGYQSQLFYTYCSLLI